MSLISAVTENLTLELAAFIAGVIAATAYLRQITSKPKEAQPDVGGQVAARLCELADGMADRVSKHHALVGQFTKTLTPFCEPTARHAEALKEAASQTVAANEKLQLRLERAVHSIRQHSRELRARRARAAGLL